MKGGGISAHSEETEKLTVLPNPCNAAGSQLSISDGMMCAWIDNEKTRVGRLFNIGICLNSINGLMIFLHTQLDIAPMVEW